MLTLSKTPHKTTDQTLKRSASVAEHYGFLPIEAIMPDHGKKTRSKIPQHTEYTSHFDNELASVIRSYIEHGHTRLTEPTLFYQSSVNSKNPNKALFGLHVLGSSHSIAEALLIKTALATLDDLGVTGHRVHVNSIGDRDSATRFTKELTEYLRKNINEMPALPRQAMKKDVFHAYDQLLKKQHPLCASAPSTVEFLTESSRSHLREILEYLETAGVDYELDPSIIGHHDCYSKTLFEIRGELKNPEDELTVLARGGRYDELAKKAFRQQIPAAGIIFEFEKKGRVPVSIAPAQKRKPKFYFIQLGFEARIRSLVVIEMLRKAKVPVYQSLGKEQLSDQLELAHELAIPYCIIMGHKEALDGTVIVRNIDSRAQETIPIMELPQYLKTL
ncbi:MAG: His/Gly/Thr/Pro-type tRNA ligase C-terminal domain-containing protein [Candidatus Paceibacterota bacterium]